MRALAALIAVLSPVAFAEVRLTGRVIDDDNAPIAGVRIWVKSAATEVDTASDLRGAFVLRLAAPGEYRPSAQREGYFQLKDRPVQKTGKSKAVRGDELERQVWSGVETFLRDPEPVLQQLHARLELDAKGSEPFRKLVTRLEGLLAQKLTNVAGSWACTGAAG